MKKVKFKQDYRGVLTGELFYPEGAEAELPDGQADGLVKEGRVEFVKEKPVQKPKPAPKKKPPAKKKPAANKDE